MKYTQVQTKKGILTKCGFMQATNFKGFLRVEKRRAFKSVKLRPEWVNVWGEGWW